MGVKYGEITENQNNELASTPEQEASHNTVTSSIVNVSSPNPFPILQHSTTLLLRFQRDLILLPGILMLTQTFSIMIKTSWTSVGPEIRSVTAGKLI